MSYYSKVFYTISSQTAGSKQFTVQFGLESGTPTTNNRPYIHTSHIKVKVDGVSTTDFAIMFLATEGLYAEIIRQPALVQDPEEDGSQHDPEGAVSADKGHADAVKPHAFRHPLYKL